MGLGSSLLFVLGSLVGAAACAYWSGMLSTRHGDWSIGIYSSDNSHPLAFSGKGIRNPAITAADVADFPAQFVADPFLMWNDGRYLLFFEGWNRETDQGDICLSSSGDGLTWHYDRVVLDEPYSLSYPQVFLWKGNWYLIPCIPSGAVQLYKANKFPYEWQYVQTVLQGERFQDVSVLEYGDSLWLFAGAGNRDELRLYSSETPLGPWQEHPRSPIIEGDPNHARPGGKPLQVADRIFRFAQDCSPYYGNQVWAFEVTELTPTSYAERLYRDLPVLMGFEDWNVRGMHTLSAIPGRNGGWIAAVDGHGRFGDKKDFED